jgi:hypothetical protein
VIRLGLRLSLRGGREAAVRLVLITGAVAAGVAVLLSTLAVFHAFEVTADRPCWECTTGTAPGTRVVAGDDLLWNFREDYYAGQTIKRLDVAALGAQAPVMPGIPRVPDAGTYYASPALARLLDAVPSDRLADRFPGTRAGLIGKAALSGPDELAVVIGQRPGPLTGLKGTVRVDAIATRPASDGTTAWYRYGFGLAAIGLVFPLLVLIGTASRLAAARREERFAAIRLVGATSRQINVIASVDAAAGALLGTLLGVVAFQAVRPTVENVAITGPRYFPEMVAPTALQYAAVLVGVPVAAACAALWSLRRVRITPLGTAKKAIPPPPRAWRVIPLVAGLALFAGPVFTGGGGDPDPVLLNLGLVLIMIGLVVGGPWLTMRAARLVARFAPGAAGLLAARRLAADPRAAFRSVNGLVLAVFLGTAIAGIVPAVISGQQAVGGGTLGNVLRASFTQPSSPTAEALSPETGADLLGKLRSYPGVTVLPVYAREAGEIAPEPARPEDGREPSEPDCGPGPECGGPPPAGNVVDCASLARFAVVGRCAAGGGAVAADFFPMLNNDNMLTLDKNLPVVGESSETVATPLTGLDLAAVLVGTDDPAMREKVRTLLASYTARSGAVGAPQTFAEVAQARAVLLDRIEHVALVMVVLTLLVAGCGLVVAVGGGLVERRRPFTVLRLGGTPVRALYRVVLLESALPLLLAAVLAAGAGLGVADPVIGQLAVKGTPVALPGALYFLTVGGGLIASLLVVLAALPLLKRVTAPDNARTE